MRLMPAPQVAASVVQAPFQAGPHGDLVHPACVFARAQERQIRKSCGPNVAGRCRAPSSDRYTAVLVKLVQAPTTVVGLVPGEPPQTWRRRPRCTSSLLRP
jgi:hypothetical protein